MRRFAAVVLVVTGCATGSPPAPIPLSSCSLDDEKACVAYGSSVTGAPPAPSGQLMIGLADRAAQLPAEQAVDYWRRIEEVHSTSDQLNEVVNRRVAASYAEIARLDADDVAGDAEDFETAIGEGQAALERVRDLAEFVVKWGTAAEQAVATRALASAYAAQARNVESVELPAELSLTGRAAMQIKRDAIADELRAESTRLSDGIGAHCRKHALELPACKPISEAQPQL